MATQKVDPKGPWPAYLIMGVGVYIIVAALLNNGLSLKGLIKIPVGVAVIVYGIWKLRNMKRSS